jgi:glucosamine--fructose-6-phosphate aminotransferase (isomerizing)
VSRFRQEIGEQPDVLSRLIERSAEPLDAIAARYHELNPSGILIAARGSSDHAALYAKYLFGYRNRALVSLAAPSLFTRYASPPELAKQCVIGISQSGAGPDVLAVVEEASRQGAMTIAITNDPKSRLASAADHVLPLQAGAELSVPASKTYTASLVALALISDAIDPERDFGAAIGRLPDATRHAIGLDPELEGLTGVFSGPRAIVLGRGFNFATAEEVALKLAETSYVLARAWSIADFEHGPIAVVEPGFPILLVGGGGSVQADLEAIARRLAEYGCQVAGLFDGRLPEAKLGGHVGFDSGLPEELTPVTLAVLGQLLAHHVAVARGADPDRPRALSKVTKTW